MEDRFKIISGTDKNVVVKLRSTKTSDPIDLTNHTRIAAKFSQRNRTELEIDNATIPATKAKITVSDITFIANTAGADGNLIILQFNGVDDIATVVNDWNTANPSNTVSYSGDDGTTVLDEQTVRLTDGYDAYQPISVEGDPQLGKIRLRLLEKDTNSLMRGQNQTFTIIIDFGQNPGGQRNKGIFEKLDVLEP